MPGRFACSHCSLDETVSQLHEEIAGLRQENLTLHDELQEIAELRNENLALKGELLTMYRQLNARYGFGQCAWPPTCIKSINAAYTKENAAYHSQDLAQTKGEKETASTQ